jgi:tRNA pseudouridine32 synthase / 23S rRNA pseudouridine746 synthase
MYILYIDDHILVVDKPAGLAVQPDGWDPEAPYLLKMLEGEHGKLWVVHRLDKVTSGVMVFARTAEAHRELNRQFEGHEAQKVYHALATGEPAWDEKIAKHPLRVNVGHKHRTAVDPRAGKPSETRFKVLKRYQAAALIEARPVTGRTHQVRVHLFALGHPIVGDLLYSAEPTDLIARPALHADSLTIKLSGGTPTTFSAPHPDDFENALNRLSNIEHRISNID